MNLKEMLLRVVKGGQEVHYENVVYQTILATLNPPGWRKMHQDLMEDAAMRQNHYEQCFRAAVEKVEREDDPELLIQALSRNLPKSKDVN